MSDHDSKSVDIEMEKTVEVVSGEVSDYEKKEPVDYSHKPVDNRPLHKRILGYFWDSAGSEDPLERAFINRLDAGVLIYSTLSYFVKSVDQSSIYNAYVSGMQKDLQLYGNEYNLFGTFFNVGSISMAIPMQMVTFKFRPSLVVPTCELFWTLFTFMIPLCKTVKAVYAFRFLIGASQAICYPVFAMMISSWYKPSEMAKRMLIYDGSWAIASICSGYIMAGIYATMDGLDGVPAWKWMFLINGIMSFPVAILGFFAIPDFPNNTRALYLTPAMKELAIKRMEEIGRVGRQKMTLKRLYKFLLDWRLYAFSFPYAVFVLNGSGYMNLWLQDLGTYSTEMINILPTITNVIGFVMAYVYGVISDMYYCRWQLFLVACLFTIVGNLMLAIWDIGFSAKFAAYILPGFGTPYWGLLMSWAEDVMYDDAELRGFFPAFANAFYYAMGAWIPNVVFPTEDAPAFKPTHGYWVAFAVMVPITATIPMIYFAQKIQLKRRGLKLNYYNIPVPIEFYSQLRYTLDLDSATKNLQSELNGESLEVEQGIESMQAVFETKEKPNLHY
ncbi:major facilitator superfamily domain-containing protein [Myxozyma melibiosi]|uniref:Major facilitator superfamily domain-containing protein n=1 Tax=Myxozyma melibiosi TaxID=54550 RepID=A0ABR1FFJ7_9ASCO